MSNETRVKEGLNLYYHGLRVMDREAMFREVREWLEEMDDTPRMDDEEGDPKCSSN
jgi:hypothetical protein